MTLKIIPKAKKIGKLTFTKKDNTTNKQTDREAEVNFYSSLRHPIFFNLSYLQKRNYNTFHRNSNQYLHDE